jgi:hypothetical protein
VGFEPTIAVLERAKTVRAYNTIVGNPARKKPNGRFRSKFVALEETGNEVWTLPGGRDQKSDSPSGHFENKI